MTTCLDNATEAAPSAMARVATSTGSSSSSSSSSISSSGDEAHGGVGGSIDGGGPPRGLNERLRLAVTGGATAPTVPPAAMANLPKTSQPALVSSAVISRGNNGNIDSGSSDGGSSRTNGGSGIDGSSNNYGVSIGTGPSTGGHPPNSSISNGATLKVVSEARVASNGSVQPDQPAATLQPEPNRLKQPPPSKKNSGLATNGASPVRPSPTPPCPTQPHPVVAPASSTASAARSPVATEGRSVKHAVGAKANAAGWGEGRPERGAGESPSLSPALYTQNPPPPSANTSLPNPVAAGVPPRAFPSLPAASCRSQAASRPEADLANRGTPLPRAVAAVAAEPVPPPPPSGSTNTVACVAAPPSTSTAASSYAGPAPSSTPPVTGANVAAGGPQAGRQTGDQPAVSPPPPAARLATSPPPLAAIPAATATAPPAASTRFAPPAVSTPEESTPATPSTATLAAAPAAKRPREEKCGNESDMDVDSEIGIANGAAGLSNGQKGDDSGADAADEKVLAGSERAEGEDEGTGESRTRGAEGAPSSTSGRSNKRARVVVGAIPGEEIRPVSAPVQEPFLEVPEVSEVDVGKMVISETSEGTLTGVVESFAESEDGLGIWTIRYENGDLREIEDCGELHDDMCGYFEFAGNAAAAEGKQVRTRNCPSAQEEVRSALFGDEGTAIGKRVSVLRDKVLHEGQITKYVQPTRDGEFEQWRVTYADGEHEDMDSFELVRPLLRHVERRIEQREVEWGHRTVLVYMHRVGDSSRPFTTLSGISASMPTTIRDDEQHDEES